ncbi:MAG: protein-L-isoaspartate(D-aspartate) O-methyltransferase [Planctomycetes bacterium]|nr:protein-L-isoaspartate(D-aspartate) O-methyltransferase [Planctomycetota bacterium]
MNGYARGLASARALGILVLATVAGCGDSARDEEAWEEDRERLVESLVENGIDDPLVLAAMRKVPRHEFVPASVRGRAYDDDALPIDQDQTISQPRVVALMTQVLGLRGGERVLEIGTGSGYHAAVLAQIAAEVYTIEIVPELAESAAARLDRLGYSNVSVRQGDGYLGWPEKAPFDAIVVTAAPSHPPPALVEQLKEGGRMVLPIGESGEVQDLYLLEKGADGVQTKRLVPVRFVPMVGEAQKKKDSGDR